MKLYQTLARQNPDAFQPELAGSLATLGRVIEALQRPAEALSCYHEDIRLLQSHFLALPAAHARVMEALVDDYEQLATALNQPPDESWLTPILSRLKCRRWGE